MTDRRPVQPPLKLNLESAEGSHTAELPPSALVHGAQIILEWLRCNALTEGLGADPDLLTQLFIEAVANGSPGSATCDGEFLATLAGAAGWIGTTADSRWSLEVRLAPEVISAVLDAIADSGPRWRYAIVAARDPDSPAGRVRHTILADLGQQLG